VTGEREKESPLAGSELSGKVLEKVEAGPERLPDRIGTSRGKSESRIEAGAWQTRGRIACQYGLAK
jgi:hypothetical protein